MKRFKRFFDKQFLEQDKKRVRRSKNLRLIPNLRWRKGGKSAYSEWAYVTGIFQTLYYFSLGAKGDCRILDFGCGTGLLAIPSEPFVRGGGLYQGVDVMEDDIAFCKENFTEDWFRFEHLNTYNPTYAADQDKSNTALDYPENSFDLVTALSVWTHLGEEDALFYMKEASRVLKSGGIAIISFFYLDDGFSKRNIEHLPQISAFHNTNPSAWDFSQPAYDSEEWKTPKWTKDPEEAIGVTKKGLDKLCKEAGLKLKGYHPGSWKENTGLYFQDILEFEKEP